MNQQVIRINVNGEQLMVLAKRELQKDNSRCFNCKGHAAEVKLVVEQVYGSKGEISGGKLDELHPVIMGALQGNKFARPVCGSPRCFNSFLAILSLTTAA